MDNLWFQMIWNHYKGCERPQVTESRILYGERRKSGKGKPTFAVLVVLVVLGVLLLGRVHFQGRFDIYQMSVELFPFVGFNIPLG